ncbi:hypothetical protein U9M48_026388, partial [Paspalum notatum var. saurae]
IRPGLSIRRRVLCRFARRYGRGIPPPPQLVHELPEGGGGARAVAAHEHLGDVGGRDAHPGRGGVGEQALGLGHEAGHGVVGVLAALGAHAEVVLGEHAQRGGRAVPELDLAVHAARAEQRRVEALRVVGGEHHQALADAGRPEPVHEVEHPGEANGLAPDHRHGRRGGRRHRGDLQGGGVLVAAAAAALLVVALLVAVGEVERAVDVLDDDHGLGRGGDEQAAEVGVGGHGGELQVVDVELEEVGDGGHEAGLARAGRAVEQVPALPRAADARVVLPARREAQQVGADLLAQRGVQGQRVEGGRVREGVGRPEAVVVVAGPRGAPASAALDGARGGGPLDADAAEGVVGGVRVRERRDGARRLARLVEPHRGRRGEAARAEVELRRVVEVVGSAAGAVGLVDEDGAPGRAERGGDPREDAAQEQLRLRREEVAHGGPEHHERREQGAQRPPVQHHLHAHGHACPVEVVVGVADRVGDCEWEWSEVAFYVGVGGRRLRDDDGGGGVVEWLVWLSA